MITYYLVKSTQSGKYYSCSASNYGEAVKILQGFGFRLNDWNVIHSCNNLIKHVKVCEGLTIAKTNVIRSYHLSGRRLGAL